MEQLVDFIIVFNFIVLVGLLVVLKRLQKQNWLDANKFALILNGYFSYSFITPLLPLLVTNTRVTLIVDSIFLLILWPIGYPWSRWLYRKFSARNQ